MKNHLVRMKGYLLVGALAAPVAFSILVGLCTSGCAAGNTGAKLSVSHVNLGALPALSTSPPAPVVLPRACAAELLAPALPEPRLPDDAFFPAPETPAASSPTTNYLQWLHAHEDWAKAGWARAALAGDSCRSQ